MINQCVWLFFWMWILQISYIGQFGSGDADSVVPLTATRYSIDALFLPTVTNWYPWYDDEEVSQCHHYIHLDIFTAFFVLESNCVNLA